MQPLVKRGSRPLLTIKDGKIGKYFPFFVKAENREKKILDFTKKFSGIRAIGLEYAPEPTGKIERIAKELKEKLNRLYPGTPVYFSIFTPVIGVHAGPGAIAIALETEGSQDPSFNLLAFFWVLDIIEISYGKIKEVMPLRKPR
jgi:hypothetical protein